MAKLFFYLFKTARPRQWLKNLAVFSPIIFTGQLFNPTFLSVSVWTFLILCAASSANYLFNDVLDAPKDRKHPFKKNRPVASGQLPTPVALVSAVILVLISLFGAILINPGFLVITFIFLVLEFSYSLFLKKMSVIDILAITLAYILRVYAGEIATGFHLSIWLFLTVLSLSLFLAIGKRRAELTLIGSYEGMVPKDTRASLSHYSEKLLDIYIAIAASLTFITYAFYSFLERPASLSLITFITPERKWLMLTVPFVLFGIMRYLQLIYENKEGESPERVLTSDWPLMITVLSWGMTVIFIIYGLGG